MVGVVLEAVEQGLAGPAVGALVAEEGAQLRVAVPGVVFSGIVFQHRLPGGAALLQLAPEDQDLGQVPGAGAIRIRGAEGHSEGCDGPVPVARVAQGPA